MVTPPAAQEWADAYAAGRSAYDIARDAGVHPATVQHAISGLTPARPRGARPVVDEAVVLREMEADPTTSIRSIALRLGVSPHAVRHAMHRAGIAPRVGVPMSAAQTRRLAGLARKTPAGKGAHYDLRSDAGQRMLVEIGRLVDRGVHPDEIGMVCGVTGMTVQRWLR